MALEFWADELTTFRFIPLTVAPGVTPVVPPTFEAPIASAHDEPALAIISTSDWVKFNVDPFP